MYVPLSWIKDYVDIDLPLDELARVLTMTGLEVDSIRVVGLPLPEGYEENHQAGNTKRHEFKITGLPWSREHFVVAQVDEVMPHPNADRLVLCRLNDGVQDLVVLTGAPNLYPYKGQGPLPQPIKVAYAREGARLYDGHQPGQVLTTLKRAKIRGVESFSMVCSEKELGISEEHEGIILLDPDAPTGQALADYMGDAVFEISILPNMIRNACVLGVAREIAAQTGKPLHKPVVQRHGSGPDIAGQVDIRITDPDLNPRFVLGMVRNAEPKESPYWVQRRLRLAGMRPINSIVDATNYVMLVYGEPLHAFDYDTLVQRAGGKAPTIITRAADPGEHLMTLDGVERTLDDETIVVADTAGTLSLAGVMGGMESEVTDNTCNVLLEGACWNFVNVRRTVSRQRLASEAGYRFARGIHPALSEDGVRLGLDCIAAWSGGEIASGLVDAYPKPAIDPLVTITPAEVERSLGIQLSAELIADLLTRLEFTCRVEDGAVVAQTPAHRLDIGEGLIGKADLLEEIARMYGYDRIPATRLADSLPPQRRNMTLEREEKVRDILANLGLQEVITYRMTHPEHEARLLPSAPTADLAYVTLQNPITPDRSVMRRNLLASVMDVVEHNIRIRERLALFEVAPVFIPQSGQDLPDEPLQLAIVLSGLRYLPAWDRPEKQLMDFYDMKGIVESLLDALHVGQATFQPTGDFPTYHPGKCAQILLGEVAVGVFGELHPLVKEHFDLGQAPLLAAEIDLGVLLDAVPLRHEAEPVPVFPPVLEDIAVIVDEDLPAQRVVDVIRQGGGKLLKDVRLFDIYRGDQIGAGKKSLAYSLTYLAEDRTLTDSEATKVRQRIIRRLEDELGVKLRS
ncbi:MAG: phenylalanine--tRNA ligase subunit beta [Chloroflexi bacterium]|nr:phenylalanine--tRNA ligase subunit beta [Anaerolineaceae bacterium]NMB88649.1 phenylalanine--tRNA ligase subunit beta [Chloroflexota bacterium]